jgi:hypothetical protein
MTEVRPGFIQKSYKILPQSTLEVNGKTNINSFCCNSKERFPSGQLSYQIENGSAVMQFENATLNIQISKLDCGAKAINKDLNKALQADQYPNITIDLKEAFNLECNDLSDCDRWIDFETNSDITIVCTSKSVNIPVKVKKVDEQRFQISGGTNIKLCDFGVEAPTALLGLIKVKDRLEIKFDLLIDIY